MPGQPITPPVAAGPITYAQASPQVRAVFDDIKAARNVEEVNNFWMYLANDPIMLEATWAMVKGVMSSGALDAKTKELIYVAISITNACEYCMASHQAAAKAKGATQAELAELFSVVALANMTNRLATAYKVPVDSQFLTVAPPLRSKKSRDSHAPA